MLFFFFCHGSTEFNLTCTSCIIYYLPTPIVELFRILQKCWSIIICTGNVCLEILITLDFVTFISIPWHFPISISLLIIPYCDKPSDTDAEWLQMFMTNTTFKRPNGLHKIISERVFTFQEFNRLYKYYETWFENNFKIYGANSVSTVNATNVFRLGGICRKSGNYAHCNRPCMKEWINRRFALRESKRFCSRGHDIS
jgi:hypothetical protein